MPLNVASARDRLASFRFEALFLEDLGWDRYPGSLEVAVGDQRFVLRGIAEKRGMVAYTLEGPNGELIAYPIRRKIERQVARSVHEHLIVYTDRDQSTQVWQWVGHDAGRITPREHIYHRSHSGEALIQKLDRLVFTLDEEALVTIVDVTQRVRAAFDVERVTRRFYERFRSEHDRFIDFITGLTNQQHLEWYASVMLNRLMFVYFIQRKGFLDDDRDYLRNRLGKLRDSGASDQFHSFYRHFLLRLFHDGLSRRPRSTELETLLGRVPYLNGGLFEVHELEQQYSDIQIPDHAFERLFDFFDSYQWHLDDRPLRSDTDVNPDVLGYIFEKYINQKEMGAYYTREDITDYIAGNCVIPCLFRKVDAASTSFSWTAVTQMMADDPRRYVHPIVAHGADRDLPNDVSPGMRPPEDDNWGRPAPPAFALPGESWSQVLARRQQYEALIARLTTGPPVDAAELPSLNLRLRLIAEDMIDRCESPSELCDIYRSLESLSVLDPTCGSGAFLFAAVNISEPLYDAAVERMEAFMLDSQGDHDMPDEFSTILARVHAHASRSFFILKTIVMKNTYGVDIMEEAVEICKLRFFLRMVAQIDRVEDLEPLPDIDFNIRAGNALIGFATRDELRHAMGSRLDYEESAGRIDARSTEVDEAFSQFRDIQLGDVVDDAAATIVKRRLREKLAALRGELNTHLAVQSGQHDDVGAVARWVDDHHPFHWFVEFHDTMVSGGFDVIIGNPPYVEVPLVTSREMLRLTFRTALIGGVATRMCLLSCWSEA